MITNRLHLTLRNAALNQKKLFCAFLTLGYPSMIATEKLIFEFEREGVDIIELGIPFSDPLADGPTIQFASEQALKRGVSLADGLKLVEKLREKGCRIPILCFTYLNPVYRYGLSGFGQAAKRAGFDGLIIPDLPPDSERIFNQTCRKHDLAQVFLIAPTTSVSRADLISRATRGFVYYVSIKGVTGARKNTQGNVKSELQKLRRVIRQPVLIGFGVSTPAQAKQYSQFSSGVIVGSAIIDQIRKNPNHLGSVVQFIRTMVRAVKH